MVAVISAPVEDCTFDETADGIHVEPADVAKAREATRSQGCWTRASADVFTGDEHYAGRSSSQGTELCAVVEYARSVLGYADAHSTEMTNITQHPVIDLMEEQRSITDKGGTMRLGAQQCKLAKGTISRKLYAKDVISERHRHRYEFNNGYRQELEDAGLKVAGTSIDGRLVEMVEIPAHPWFVACQFHPEFTSTPRYGHPLFKGFVDAAILQREKKVEQAVSA